MQRFPCPFCGLRDEREFHFLGEAGKTRPDTTGPVSAEAWQAWLYARTNPKGASREVWMHLTCAEVFLLERDTVSMQVTGAVALRDGPEGGVP